MASPFDPALLRRWIAAAEARLDACRADIDRINLFPVADHDTGSNLLLTVRAAAGFDDGSADPAGALAAAAVRGARGNSGLILSQLFRGVAEELAADRGGAPGPGAAAVLAGGLRRAAALATSVLSAPRPGTALTVLDAAAAAAAAAAQHAADRAAGGGLAAVARTAARAARAALGTGAGRPAELVRAGVVDAGGAGVVAVLDALVVATGGDPGAPPAVWCGPADPATGTAPAETADTAGGDRPGGVPQPVYEVTYRLTGAGPGELAALRARLGALGDSVAVAGDGAGAHTVHVHTATAGPAVEAGLVAGRPSAIRIEALPAAARTRARAVLLMIESAGAGALAAAAGGDVLPADPDPDADAVCAAVRATGAGHVAVLPCAAHRRAVAETAAERIRDEGTEVVVVPSTSVLQGLAALAVHDPDRRASDDVVAMAEAAAGTRTGGLRIADAEALTWAGPCRPGEVLGLSDGEVVLIAPDLAVGALWLAHRMLTPGGELVTVLLGAAADDALGRRLAEDLRRTHPEVDVVVHRGDQGDYPLVLGVE